MNTYFQNALPRAFLCFVAGSAVLVANTGISHADTSFSLGDDIAVSVDGTARTGFFFGENTDLDSEHAPGTRNWIETRLRLEPTLWINEIAQFVGGLDLMPDRRWGDNGSWVPEFRYGYVQLVTPVGRLRLGRQTRAFGAGLAWHEGVDEDVPYGFLHELPTEDRIDWLMSVRFGDFPLEGGMSFGILNEPQLLGHEVWGRDDTIRLGFVFGLQDNEQRKVHAQYLYDAQGADSLHRHDLSLFGDVLIAGHLRLTAEAGIRRGTTSAYTFYDGIARGYNTPELSLAGYRARLDVAADHVRLNKGIFFSGSRLTGFLATGPDSADPVENNTLSAAGSAEGACRCLLLESWALQSLRSSRQQRRLSALPTGAPSIATTSLKDLYASMGALDGFWGMQLHGVLGYRDLLSTLSLTWMRSVFPAESRKLLNAHTSVPDDDEYIKGQNTGFEIDLAVRYRFVGSIDLGIDTGLLFPDELMFAPGATQGPAFALMPRLTVLF